MYKNEYPNAVYELNTDEFYAYGFAQEEWSYMKYEVILRDAVEPQFLQDALSLVYERFLYFKVMLTKEDNPERLVLKTNPHHPMIFATKAYVAIDDPRLEGHLIAISYDQKK